jgi:hypothetical protein
MVLLSELHVDPEAQRRLSVPWVKAHAPNFDVDQLGYIVVNKRANGKIYVIDGQHRVELMRAVGWGDQKVHAECFDRLSQAQEAELFNARNDRKAVRLFDKFRIAVTAGDPVACDIDRIIKEHGLLISDQSRPGHVVAVHALQRIYSGAGIASQKEGAEALSKALVVLLRSWGKQISSVNGKVIEGIGMLELRYNGGIDQNALAKKLAPFPGGPAGLLGRGRSMQEMHARPLHHCIASIIVDVYNKGRRTGKLDAWES